MTDHRARVDELLADYRRSRGHLATVHQQLAAVSASASSDDGSITATVGPRGTLTGLTLTDEAYRRYRPAELATEILRLTATASSAALSQAGELIAPALPAGTDPAALLLGTADLSPDELRPEPVAPSAVRTETEDDGDFEERSWLAEGWRGQR